jgi:hypothetical protein
MLQQAAVKDEQYLKKMFDAQETAAAELAAFKGNAAATLAYHKKEATAALAALSAEASTEKAQLQAQLQAQYQAQFQAQFDQELAAKKRYVIRCATYVTTSYTYALQYKMLLTVAAR